MYSVEIRKMMLSNRISKLSNKPVENANLINKAKRRLRRLST